MKCGRRCAQLVTAVVSALASVMAAWPNPAVASPQSEFPDCAYPYVCLYKYDSEFRPHRTGQFRDVTTGWQYLTRSYGPDVLVNTRHDDVLYLKYAGGVVSCLPPNTVRAGDIAVVVAIRISWSNVCRL